MKIKQLELVNYRNYLRREFEFAEGVTVMVGPNAVGKTNVLEAVYMLATGESFQAQKVEEMVGWEGEVSHVVAKIINNQLSIINDHTKKAPSEEADIDFDELELGVRLTRGVVQGKKVQMRKYLVNGVARRKQDFLGNCYAVIFRPQDLRLVEGSPSRRREFLDRVLVQVDAEYRRSVMSYEKGLRRRNRVLTQVREGETSRTALAFWDKLLVKEGEVMYEKRRDFLEYLNVVQSWRDDLRVKYKPSMITDKRLEEYGQREIGAGHTLIGPHKDDFYVMSNVKVVVNSVSRQMSNEVQKGRDLSIYGSRGEQRMAVLWLKLGELAFIRERVGQEPLLLLDDIFSELDDEHDAMVMQVVGKHQAILTTTDLREEFGERGWEVVELG